MCFWKQKRTTQVTANDPHVPATPEVIELLLRKRKFLNKYLPKWIYTAHPLKGNGDRSPIIFHCGRVQSYNLVVTVFCEPSKKVPVINNWLTGRIHKISTFAGKIIFEKISQIKFCNIQSAKQKWKLENWCYLMTSPRQPGGWSQWNEKVALPPSPNHFPLCSLQER